MRILVVGTGGREHALIWKLSQEAEVFAAPGNAGIANDCQTFDVAASDAAGLVALAKRIEPNLVLIGPEDPLISGVANILRKDGLAVFGPGREGARLEASKVFAKDQMEIAGIPTAPHSSFRDPEAALDYATAQFASDRQVAIKASGPALGKGVFVCDKLEDAEEAIEDLLIHGSFGEAGREIVIEDRLFGREFSLLTVCAGEHYRSLPAAQDYKRALDRDRGPNTGGMGSYSPVEWVGDALVRETERCVVEPMLKLLKDEGIDFNGILFSGMMLTDSGPQCLEFNVRFGDPETQTIVRRLGVGFAELLLAASRGKDLPKVEFLDQAAVTVVLASKGYPGKIQKGMPIEIDPLPAGVVVFHAGTAMVNGKLCTNGGRVLGVTGVRASTTDARRAAYEAIPNIRFDGMQYRHDIANELPSNKNSA